MQMMDETETLEYAIEHSIARFGDGELRLAVGGSCSSQRQDSKLAAELCAILAGKSHALACIPDFVNTPRKDVWDKYSKPPFQKLYSAERYGSSFITRPDNAPWIDTPLYWQRVQRLWEGKDVILVASRTNACIGTGSIKLPGVKRWTWVEGPERHAYSDIDRIEKTILDVRCNQDCTVLLSLGATATVLAARLAAKGVHALDLGHIWHFMNHAGAFRFSMSDLRTKAYATQLHQKHRKGKWGRDGHSHADTVIEWMHELGQVKSILDYGCGAGTLAKALEEHVRVYEYDPGIRGKDHLPKPAGMLVCTDVLEHIEPEMIDNVLKHQYALAERGAYFVIALKLARETLPDGRNAHLLVKDPQWWLDSLTDAGWKIEKHEVAKGLRVWARK